MSWTTEQTGYILRLAESGVLTHEQLARARQLAPLQPDRSAWLKMTDRLLAYAGILLLTAGIIFFFAYNWADLHRFAKIGLAAASLTACVAVAFRCQLYSTGWRAALLGACVCTGALLALVGQTYQTGADVRELFFYWTILMLPFALLARSSACWILWLLVLNLTLYRYLSVNPFFGSSRYFFGANLLLIASINFTALACLELLGVYLLTQPRRLARRLAACAALLPLTFDAGFNWLGDWLGTKAPFSLLTFFVCAALMLFIYYQLRRDVAMLALSCSASIAVLTGELIQQALFFSSGDFFSLNLIALFVIASSGATATWLLRLYKAERLQTQAPEGDTQ